MNDQDARSIVAMRVFDAPRELVWKMWTEPEHIKHWWGPRGFTNTIHSMDVRAGGKWSFIMHGPDGRDYRNEIVYTEVDAPKRLGYSHGPSPRFDVTVTFEDRGDKTAITMRMLFETVDLRNQVAATYGAEQGLHQTLDRLGEQLANTEAVVISRTFDAPRELMFRVWTERDHLQHWFGPKDVVLFHCTNDPRPGGVMHYGMRTPDGGEMWGRWIYRELTPPRRLVFVVSFSDPDKGISRAPFDGMWPLEMLSTVTFEERGEQTHVTVQWAAINANEDERRTFTEGHDSMRMGWAGTFEQLAKYLPTLH